MEFNYCDEINDRRFRSSYYPESLLPVWEDENPAYRGRVEIVGDGFSRGGWVIRLKK